MNVCSSDWNVLTTFTYISQVIITHSTCIETHVSPFRWFELITVMLIRQSRDYRGNSAWFLFSVETFEMAHEMKRPTAHRSSTSAYFAKGFNGKFQANDVNIQHYCWMKTKMRATRLSFNEKEAECWKLWKNSIVW